VIPTWSVVVTGSARRQPAERLPQPVAAACIEFLKGPLAADPHRVGPPLRKPFEGRWRASRGTHRIRYRIDETVRTVYVLDVEHRWDVYRS
jgi:mRNA interferase RelE/StbE